MNHLKYQFLVIVLLFTSIACSQSGNNPVNPPGGLGTQAKTSLDTLPVIAFDGSSALGIFGAYNLILSPEGAGTELVPMRTPSLGEAYIVSGVAFFTMSPCNNCLKISSASLSTDGKLIIGMKVKHPFQAGDPLKPPTARNRLDLDVFDLALVVEPVDRTPNHYMNTNVDAYAGIILNADGYTTELTNALNIGPALPYKICYESVENNRFAMGTDYQDFQVAFDPGSGLTFNLYLTMGYGASAKKPERLVPTYYVPEFNRKMAWKVIVTPPEGFDPPAMGNTWNDTDTITPYTVTIDIYDWNHGATIAASYPDPLNTNQISAASDVSSVTVEVPGMTSAIVTANTTDPTQNGWDDPLTYTASFPNQNRIAAGVYNALVKVTDSRNAGVSMIGGETDTIVNTPDGVTLEWFNVPEFATYQVFKATVVIGGIPPTCDIHTNVDISGQGETILADPGTSADPDGSIIRYEYDASYDGTIFNADVTQNSADPDFGDPASLLMPCNTTGSDITNKIALRVTDDSSPPLSVVCSKDITITSKMGCPRKVKADTVNRGESIANVYRITSIDMNWPGNPCAVEYAIERANNGINPTGWSLLATSTTNSYKFQPTDCMGTDRLRVIARAVVGGNPASDSEPSGEILLIFDSNYTSNAHSWNACNEVSNGSSWNFNTSTWGFTSLDDVGNGGYGMASLGITYAGHFASWPNAWCVYLTNVPDIVDQDAAYVDMYYSQQSWSFGNTAAMMLGTASGILPSNQPTAFDYNGANNHKAFGQYNNQCPALDVEFGETNGMGFSGYMTWTRVSYWLDDLIDDGPRDYFGMGWANGPMDGSTGWGFNDAQVIVVY